jgi:hypothetical protein
MQPGKPVSLANDLALNPMVGVVEGFGVALLGTQTCNGMYWQFQYSFFYRC